LILFFPSLILNVFLDRFLVHRAHTRAKIAPRSQVLPQERLRSSQNSSWSLRDDRPFRYGINLAGAMSGGADTSMRI
jgi:hypothetical protein